MLAVISRINLPIMSKASHINCQSDGEQDPSLGLYLRSGRNTYDMWKLEAIPSTSLDSQSKDRKLLDCTRRYWLVQLVGISSLWHTTPFSACSGFCIPPEEFIRLAQSFYG